MSSFERHSLELIVLVIRDLSQNVNICDTVDQYHPNIANCFYPATKVVNNLVTKLPVDGHQKEPSSDVVVNICGVLNNLVTSSSLAARDITYFDGLPKLFGIKNSNDGR